MTYRRLLVLLNHLPRESAFARAIRGDEDDWTVTDYLLAAVADHSAVAAWATIAVNSKKGKAPKPPTPIQRPVQALVANPKRQASVAELKAFFN